MTYFGVTPAALRRELHRLGYVLLDDSGRAGTTWVPRDEPEGLSVVVPREEDQSVRGYSETIGSAVQRVAVLRGQPVEEVIAALRGFDEFELRILHPETQTNSLPLEAAADVVAAFVSLIKNGARTRFTGARAFHRGKAGPEYASAVERLRILAPEPGSFRLVAITSDEPQLSSDRGSLSNAREALMSTLWSLDALGRQDVAASSLSDDQVEALVDAGVSMQLLTAVHGLAFASTSGFELRFSALWDETAGNPRAPRQVKLTDFHVAFARQLRDRLDSWQPVPDYELKGWAETARALDRSLEGFPSGTVVVRTRQGGRQRDVVVNLPSELFPRVKPGISDVRMTGTLERISGRWHLLEPRDIEVTEPEVGDSDLRRADPPRLPPTTPDVLPTDAHPPALGPGSAEEDDE